MKVYLHGPRAGETININGVQFTDGVAEVPRLSVYLSRYYNVKDHPPQDDKVEEVNITIKPVDAGAISKAILESKDAIAEAVKDEVEEQVDNTDAHKELQDLVNKKKEELEKPRSLLEEFESFKGHGSFGKQKKFVRDLTGQTAKTREGLIALLKEYEGSK